MVSSIYKIFPGIIFCFVIAYSGIYLSHFIGKEILNLKKKSNITNNAINNIWSFDRKYISY